MHHRQRVHFDTKLQHEWYQRLTSATYITWGFIPQASESKFTRVQVNKFQGNAGREP